MKKALARLGESATHLNAIEDFFLANDGEYAHNEEELAKLGRYYEEFSRELYPGGRKDGRYASGGRYHRGMAFADLLTYKILARGFFAATASPEHRRAFTQIV